MDYLPTRNNKIIVKKTVKQLSETRKVIKRYSKYSNIPILIYSSVCVYVHSL